MNEWWNEPWEVLVYEAPDGEVARWKAEAKSTSKVSNYGFIAYDTTKEDALRKVTQMVENFKEQENTKNNWFRIQKEAKSKAERFLI